MALSRQIKPVQKVSYGYGYGLLLVLLCMTMTAVFWWQLPPQIPLFYSLPMGVTQLAPKEWFFVLPGLSLVIWIGYLLISKQRVALGIYIHLLKWLFVLGLFLLTIAIIHILFLAL